MRARFLSAAREVALAKPIIVIKAGRTAAAAKAAASHTGSLTGSDEVLDAAFRRVGVLRVNSICGHLLHDRGAVQASRVPKARACSSSPTPAVPECWPPTRLMAGGELASLAESTVAALDEILPTALEPQQSGGHHRRRRTRAVT